MYMVLCRNVSIPCFDIFVRYNIGTLHYIIITNDMIQTYGARKTLTPIYRTRSDSMSHITHATEDAEKIPSLSLSLSLSLSFVN